MKKIKESQTFKAFEELQEIFPDARLYNSFEYIYNEKYNYLSVLIPLKKKKNISAILLEKIAGIADKYSCEAHIKRYSDPMKKRLFIMQCSYSGQTSK